MAVTTGTWAVLEPLAATVQAALDEVDAELDDHFSAADRRHPASAVDFAPYGFISSGTVQAAVQELVDDLASSAAGTPGALRVGADAAAGTPNALSAGTVDSQLSSLLAILNAHQNASSGAHPATAISATAHNNIAATNVQAQLQEVVTDLAATGATAPGASLVGVDAISGAPNSVPAGTLRAALASLLGSLNAHANQATGAHPASAISVTDSGSNLNAVNVETALAELADAIEVEHFRGNESTPGQHRTIHQPALGSGRVLLLDSAASGQAATRPRIYADTDSVWFTLNASWNGLAWARDSTGSNVAALRFSRNEFELLHSFNGAATFTTWDRGWRLPMSSTDNSAFELSGSVRETGRLGVEYTNTDTAVHGTNLGSSITFRNRFPAAPSSITLSPLAQAINFAGNPILYLVDKDGFGFYGSQSLPALATTYWYGTYTAIA